MMEQEQSGLRSGIPPAWVLQESTHDRAGRALATIVQLPRLCRTRKCRRLKMCVGFPAGRCLKEHAGLGEARWQAVVQREDEARRRRKRSGTTLPGRTDDARGLPLDAAQNGVRIDG